MSRNNLAAIMALFLIVLEITGVLLLGPVLMMEIHAGLLMLMAVFLPAYSLFGGEIGYD